MYQKFRRKFFHCYRAFTSDDALLEALIDEYVSAGASNVTVEERIQIRYGYDSLSGRSRCLLVTSFSISVVEFVREWLNGVHGEIISIKLLTKIRDFARTIIEPETVARKAVDIIRTATKFVRDQTSTVKTTLTSSSSLRETFRNP